MLKAAEARGGPATYRKRLTVLKHKAFEGIFIMNQSCRSYHYHYHLRSETNIIVNI